MTLHQIEPLVRDRQAEMLAEAEQRRLWHQLHLRRRAAPGRRALSAATADRLVVR